MRCLEDRDKHKTCRHQSTVTLEHGVYEPMAVEKVATTIQIWQTSFAEMAPRKGLVIYVYFQLHKDSLFTNLVENLSEQHDYCDVHFKLDCGSIFKAHGVMLAAESRYFRKHFKKTTKNKEGKYVITVHDAKPQTLATAFHYLYSGSLSTEFLKISGDLEQLQTVCDIAKKFEIEHLLSHCSELLLSMLTQKNVCLVYEWPTMEST